MLHLDKSSMRMSQNHDLEVIKKRTMDHLLSPCGCQLCQHDHHFQRTGLLKKPKTKQLFDILCVMFTCPARPVVASPTTKHLQLNLWPHVEHEHVLFWFNLRGQKIQQQL